MYCAQDDAIEGLKDLLFEDCHSINFDRAIKSLSEIVKDILSQYNFNIKENFALLKRYNVESLGVLVRTPNSIIRDIHIRDNDKIVEVIIDHMHYSLIMYSYVDKNNIFSVEQKLKKRDKSS